MVAGNRTKKCTTDLSRQFMVATRTFTDTISEDHRAKIMELALSRIGCHGENQYGECVPNFIVFDPEWSKTGPVWGPTERYEDDGRTLRVAAPGLEDKVYVKLDDYDSKEEVTKNVGRNVGTQFVTTFMLASDY